MIYLNLEQLGVFEYLRPYLVFFVFLEFSADWEWVVFLFAEIQNILRDDWNLWWEEARFLQRRILIVEVWVVFTAWQECELGQFQEEPLQLSAEDRERNNFIIKNFIVNLFFLDDGLFE